MVARAAAKAGGDAGAFLAADRSLPRESGHDGGGRVDFAGGLPWPHDPVVTLLPGFFDGIPAREYVPPATHDKGIQNQGRLLITRDGTPRFVKIIESHPPWQE